ncbi:MAG: hypothetical protein Kow00133_03600 [Amphiplicatus sp.]
MLSLIGKHALKSFAARYDYDASYMEHMLAVSPSAFAKFARLAALSKHRQAAPVEAAFAAKLVGAMTEDCGPCVQLVVRMAEEAGMASDQIEATLKRDTLAMSADVALAFRFADALARRHPSLDEARAAVRAAWGDAGVIDLTVGMQAGRLYPMIKLGLGFARTCQRVSIGGRAVDVAKEAA